MKKVHFLLIIAFFLFAQAIFAQQLQSISIGRNYYAFASKGWGYDKILPSTIASLEYSRLFVNKNNKYKKLSISLDGYISGHNLFLTKKEELGKITSREALIVNVNLGTNYIRPDKYKKHQLFLNAGVSCRFGVENWRITLDREAGPTKDVYIPGLNIYGEYIYQFIPHFNIKTILGTSMYIQSTYALMYGGIYVGWCFGQKEK